MRTKSVLPSPFTSPVSVRSAVFQVSMAPLETWLKTVPFEVFTSAVATPLLSQRTTRSDLPSPFTSIGRLIELAR